MNPVDEMLKETETTRGETPEGAEIIRPYSTRAWDELAEMELTPPEIVWGGFALGGSCVIFGQGGLGKSRLALNLARNQVLGIPFAGLPTAARPLRHLMMGSENSIHRLQNDVRKMGAGLAPEQVAKLGAHIQLATLEGADDSHISLASPANVERWAATLEAWPPDVLWADPWGDVLAGEANGDEDTRATLSALRRLLRKANPAAGLGILAHARTGARNIMQAIGYDAANFGKGSKALYSAARCVWNLAPGDEGENPVLVCVHAKSNDAPKFPPFAVSLDPETMLYTRAADFDFEGWQSEVAARANGKAGTRRGPRLTEDAAFDALGDETGTAAEVHQRLRESGATRDEADDLCKRLVVAGRWERWRPALRHTPVYIGPPDAMNKRRKLVAEQAQGRMEI